MSTACATVALVGAGPGDPELITLRGLRRLQAADLVLYDALVAPELLTEAPRSQRFFVGKRAGRRSMKQQTIHKLMIRAARRGQRVVRLKCGDPFVFGRGGEEALALAQAGVPFEVVPGLTTAVSAPALAGIPVTHREASSALVVVSGHAPSAWRPVLGALAPHTATVVVLMGLAGRAELGPALLQRGWSGRTPAAILWAAGSKRALTWIGTLAELGQAPTPPGAEGAPGTLCIGEVVGVAERIASLQGAASRTGTHA
jgi:uroporphyrin-III C-methyltransferase / precorrin-2 dehydrogenase / sirohydrochlorin ferrochelatase